MGRAFFQITRGATQIGMFFSNHTRFEIFNLEKTKKCSHAYYSPECTFSPWCILPVGLSKKAESLPSTSRIISVKWYFDVHYITALFNCQYRFLNFVMRRSVNNCSIQSENPIDYHRQDFRFGRDDRIWKLEDNIHNHARLTVKSPFNAVFPALMPSIYMCVKCKATHTITHKTK